MMKKLIVLFLFVGFMFSAAYGQKIEYGLCLGFNKAQISPKPHYLYNDEELVKGICGGLSVKFLLSNRLSLHSGILYFKLKTAFFNYLHSIGLYNDEVF